MVNLAQASTLRQYVVILVVNLNMICLGVNLSWASPMLNKLQHYRETFMTRLITPMEGSLMSMGIICSPPLFFTTRYLMNKIGKKRCLLISCILRLVTALALLFASQMWVMLLFRAIDMAFTIGMVLAVVPTYSSEIASKETRASLESAEQFSSAIGITFCLCFAPFLQYHLVNMLYVVLVAVTCIAVFFLPESPYYLYTKGQEQESAKILTLLRGSSALANEEMKQYKSSLNGSARKPNKKETFPTLITFQTISKIVLLSIVLEFYVITVLLVFLVFILRGFNTADDAIEMFVLSNFTQLIMYYSSIYLTDRVGSKPVLITTLIGAGVGVIGVFIFIVKNIHLALGFHVPVLTPLLSIWLIIICSCAGLRSLILILITDLLETSGRSIGVPISMFSGIIGLFFCNLHFYNAVEIMGRAPMYWWQSFNCIITGCFLSFCISEIKRKTVAQIQSYSELE